jgi:hypothetical protein
MAWVNGAAEYRNAADVILDNKSGLAMTLRDPVSFLYCHSIELLLKGYLSTKNVPPRKTHSVVKLFEDAKAQGLAIPVEDVLGIDNVLGLLQESIDNAHAFRYFKFGNSHYASTAWIRKVAHRLDDLVRPAVEAWDKANPGGDSWISLNIHVEEPTEKAAP